MKLLPRWRQYLHKNKSKSTIFMEALARMSDLDIAKVTEDALGCRLPQFEDTNAHRTPLNSCTDAYSDERPKEAPVPLPIIQTASLATARAESHENPLKISDRARRSSPKRGERHSNSATGKKVEKSSFELQEVIIDVSAGVCTQQLAQLRSAVHYGSDDRRAAFSLNLNSSDISFVAIPVKTIGSGALAPEQRGKVVARSLKAILQRPNEFAGVRSQHEAPSTSVHVEYGQSTAGTDCVVAKMTAARHLPRSHLGSQMKSSGKADSVPADHSAGQIMLTAAARKTEHASAVCSSQDYLAPVTLAPVTLAPVTPAATAPCITPQLPPRSRSQFRSTVPDTGFLKRIAIQHHQSAETLDVALDTVAAQRKGLGSAASSVALLNLPQAPPRSRGRATEASRELATKDRLEHAADSCSEISSRRVPPQSTIASSLHEQARSKKTSSKKTKNDSPPPISTVQRLRMAGAEFEEC